MRFYNSNSPCLALVAVGALRAFQSCRRTAAKSAQARSDRTVPQPGASPAADDSDPEAGVSDSVRLDRDAAVGRGAGARLGHPPSNREERPTTAWAAPAARRDLSTIARLATGAPSSAAGRSDPPHVAAGDRSLVGALQIGTSDCQAGARATSRGSADDSVSRCRGFPPRSWSSPARKGLTTRTT